MSIEDYEVVIGLEVHENYQQKQKYSAHVQPNLVENQTHIAVQYVWQCLAHFQYLIKK